MSPRITRLVAARQTRTITVCAAVVGAVITPAIASAATAVNAAPAASAYTRVVHKANTATSSANTVASATTTAVAVADTTTTNTYTIQSGDTLFGIAQRSLGSGQKYHKLFKLNKGRAEGNGQYLTKAGVLDVGWTIVLPDGVSVAAAPAQQPATAPVASTSDSSSTDTSGSSSDSSSTSSSSASSDTSSSSSDTSSSSSSSSSSDSSSSSSSGYADDLDGWINQAVSVLAANGYSVSYNAIYETAMNESSGNPNAENGWDSNAAAGTPSIGLLQVIQPTFDAYALPGYNDIWNPVDNIIAGAIYAQDTYGGLDNVVAARCGGSCWVGY
jgi:Transglycosylase SLT domain/LysM domain